MTTQGAERVAPGQEDQPVPVRVRAHHQGSPLHCRQEDGQKDGGGHCGGGGHQVRVRDRVRPKGFSCLTAVTVIRQIRKPQLQPEPKELSYGSKSFFRL